MIHLCPTCGTPFHWFPSRPKQRCSMACAAASRWSPELLWRRVEKTEGCWVWHGWRNTNGYGMVTKDGRTQLVHRLIYELLVGLIPTRMLLCHHCDNPPCVNPAHMFVGTVSDNARDAMQKGRTLTGARNGNSREARWLRMH